VARATRAQTTKLQVPAKIIHPSQEPCTIRQSLYVGNAACSAIGVVEHRGGCDP